MKIDTLYSRGDAWYDMADSKGKPTRLTRNWGGSDASIAAAAKQAAGPDPEPVEPSEDDIPF